MIDFPRRMRWVVGLGGMFLVTGLVLAATLTTWGPYHGITGSEWLRFWGSVLAPLILGTTASIAAVIAWLTLEQNRKADLQRFERERRAEFWDRLRQAIELATSPDLNQAKFGADLLAYIYTDLQERGEATTEEMELLVGVLASLESIVYESRKVQAKARRRSPSWLRK